MSKKLQLILVFMFMMVNISPSFSENQASSAANIPNVSQTEEATSPYFAIQILALKEPSNNIGFFGSFGSVREFKCADGYYRYVVGQYNSKAEALSKLDEVRSKGKEYAKSYVVNTQNYPLGSKPTIASKQTETPQEVNIDKNDKFAHLRTSKKIIVVDRALSPYFAIQLLAMKTQPQDPRFFENVEYAREFNCTDGYTRWVVGQYETKEDAYADLSKTRSLSPKYKDAFIVNTSNYKLTSSDFSSTSTPSASSERTDKRIMPVDGLSEGYSIQVLALKSPPKDASFFEKLQTAKEVACLDGYTRYFVGDYQTKEDAYAELAKVRSIGAKYKDAFVVENSKIKIQKTAFASNYNSDEKAEKPILTQKRPTETVTISGQVNDNLEISKQQATQPRQAAEKNQTAFKTEQTPIVGAKEASNILPASKTSSVRTNNQVENISTQQTTQTALKTEQTPTVGSKEANSILPTSQTSSLRTNKKIEPVENVSTPYYTVQLLAIKDTPKDPNFFDNIQSAKEFSCTDGYKRYVVGEYKTREEAVAELKKVKTLSPKYKNAFIANTGSYEIEKNAFSSKFTPSNTSSSIKSSDIASTSMTNANTNTSNAITTTPITVANAPTTQARVNTVVDTQAKTQQTNNTTAANTPKQEIVLSPDKIYTIQITASRYPFYTSELKEFSQVFEFYMPDKVYRYTEGKYRGEKATEELEKVISYGYKEAFIVEWDKYAPYQIE